MSEPSKARLQEIARRHKPRGWKLSATGKHPNEGDGFQTIASVDWNTKTLIHPEIVDRHALVVYLHECGHVHYRHDKDTDHHAAEQEWEAETYAWKALRAAGIAVPRWTVKSLRRYLRNIVEGLYEKDAYHSPGYDNADIAPSDEIMRFIYGRDWRNPRADIK